MNRLKQIKLVILIIGILVFGALVLYKLIYIRSSESESLIIPKITDSQNRGDIYSSGMQLLVSSPVNYNISFDPTVPSEEGFSEKLYLLGSKLHQFFQIDSASIVDRIKSAKNANNKYVSVLKNISFSELQKVKDFPFFEDGRIPGGYIEKKTSSTRVLLHGDLAKVVLGDVYPDQKDSVYFGFGLRLQPKHGLEKYYDYLLRGKEGFQLTRKIKGNIDKNVHSRSSIYPKSGKDIVTTIDLDLQSVAHSILKRHLYESNARYGVLMVMEVATGHMKCIVNLDQDQDGGYTENFNYAVRGPKKCIDRPSVKIEPGSTFKLASYMVYFEQGGTKLDTINAEGNETRFNESIHKFPGIKKRVYDSKKLGLIDLQTAFAESSNIAICKLIYENYNLNPQKFLDGLSQLRIGEKSNIDLHGEEFPVLYKEASDLKPGSLVSLAYGYEMGFAPIQILTFYNSIANGGIRVPPTLVTSYIENGERIPLHVKNKQLSPICSMETINQARDLLRSVVTDGTADILSDLPIAVSGKTGTSKVNYAQSNDSLVWHQASFTGFFPSDNPKYSFYVLIDDPQNDYYASKVAVPVIKDLLEEYYYPPTLLDDLNLHTDLSNLTFFTTPFQLECIDNVLDNNFNSYSKSDYMRVKFDSYGNDTIFDLISNNNLNVEGMLVGDALYFLESKGYNVEIVSGNNGKVINQYIEETESFKTVFLSIE